MKRLASTLLALTVAACGGSGGSPGDTDGGTGGADANPNAPDANNALGSTLTLTIEPFDVAAGTERQVCKKVNLPAGTDLDVVQMHSLMAGTSHHMNVYKWIADPVTQPASAADMVVHDCQPAQDQLDGNAAYIFGAATPERTVDMPGGVAFHLVGGQLIVLEQHVINAGDTVIQGGVSFDLTSVADPATIEHHADIAWFANWAIYLAPGTSSITEYCTFPYDVQVFGLMSHTHRLGTHFSIEKWDGGAGEHLYDSYDWSHPPYEQYAPPFPLASGQGLQWTCEYDNTTGSVVTAGKNSTDEMCMTFAYAYPANSLDAPTVQCNKPFAP